MVELNADNSYTATINLANGITTNNELGENPATAIDLTKINSLRFWAWAGEVSATIDEMYLERDGKQYILRSNTAADKYGTICLPFAASKPDNANVYDVVGWDASNVYLSEESVSSLEAGKAYIFQSIDANDITFTKTDTDENLTEPAASTNMLHGQFSGSNYVPLNSYILKNGEWKKVVKENSNTVSNYRAYLTKLANLEVTTPSPSARVMNLDGDKTTGIKTIKTAETADAVFTLSGVQVKQPTKGIYVKNGKKFIVK